MKGRIIEERPRKFPYPKCLIKGLVEKRVEEISFLAPLYVACGVGDVIYITTVQWDKPKNWQRL